MQVNGEQNVTEADVCVRAFNLQIHLCHIFVWMPKQNEENERKKIGWKIKSNGAPKRKKVCFFEKFYYVYEWNKGRNKKLKFKNVNEKLSQRDLMYKWQKIHLKKYKNGIRESLAS